MTNKKSKTKKGIIDVYPTVYNTDIVVCNKYATANQLNKQYMIVDGSDFTEEDLTDADGCCIKAYERKTNRPVLILRYTKPARGTSKKDIHADLVNTCSHEATHAAMFICSRIGQDIDKDDVNEFLAYLIGWITECMYKTVTK